MIFLIPAILSTKQCHDYVGGRPIWEELAQHHSDLLPPFRTTRRGDSYYRRATVDHAIQVAEAAGSLVHQPDESSPLIPKQDRRFKALPAATTPV